MTEKSSSWDVERGQLLSLYSKYKNDDEKWAKILTELTLWVEKENKLDKIPLCSLGDFIADKVSKTNLVKAPDYKSLNTGKCSEESAVLMISDAHIGKVNEFFNPETNSTELTYSTKIFRKQALTLENRVADVTKMLSSSISLKKLYITFLGDILDNDRIFDGQAAQIDMCVGEQLWEGVTTFTRFINNLLAVFPEIEVHSVIGNHGRSTGKRGDEPVPNSYEFTLAKILAKSFENEPRVKFNIPHSWCGLAKIYDWRYFLHHGDSVYSWGCVDTETECLTKDGWKRGDELTEGELLMTYNPDTDSLEYQPLDEYFEYDYDGDMVNIKSKLLDCKMTPNHRCYVMEEKRVNRSYENNYNGYYTVKQLAVKDAENLTTKDSIILTAGEFSTDSSITSLSDNEVILLGWLLTEGSIATVSTGRCKITQSTTHNLPYCIEIKDTLDNLGIEYLASYSRNGRAIPSIDDSDRVDYRFYIPKAITSLGLTELKPFPRWITNLPKHQLELLLETMLKGDGTRSHYSDTLDCFYQKDKYSAELVQEIAFKLGFKASISYSTQGIWAVYLSKNRYARLGSKVKRYKEHYQGKVWCVSTKNKTWVARRNGKIWITGNSLPYYGLSRMGKSRRIEVPHDIDLCGHFHQRMEIPISQRTFTLVNGCWIMGDSYSWRKYGIISKPEQYFFGVNHKRPRTWSFNLEM